MLNLAKRAVSRPESASGLGMGTPSRNDDPSGQKARRFARQPWLAALATLVVPGIGHLYFGFHQRAVLSAFAVLTAGILSSYLAAVSFVGMIAAVAFLLGIQLLVAGDAAKMSFFSRRARAKWWVLALFLAGYLGLHQQTKRIYGSVSFNVPTESMAPTLLPGDHVMVNRAAYWRSSPKVGDVVVFRHPTTPETLFIKRVVAGPGDTVEVVRALEGEIVFVNDIPVTGSPEAHEDDFQAGEEAYFPEEIVPDGHVYLLGDNLPRSLDSRRLGYIRNESILGRVVYVYASLPDGSGAPNLARMGLAIR